MTPFDDALLLRPSDGEDDAACGDLVGRTAAAAPFAWRVAFARAYMADRSPLRIAPGYERIVALRAGAVAGLVQFACSPRYVKYLFVAPGLQGGGIGSRLLVAAEARIGLPVRLSTLSVNDAALRFYMRRGYAVVGGELEEDWHGGPVVWIDLEKAAPR